MKKDILYNKVVVLLLFTLILISLNIMFGVSTENPDPTDPGWG